MESNLHQPQHQQQQQQQQQQINSGLTRFRSAPSSYFANLLDSCEEFLNRPSSPETERIFARLMSSGAGNTSGSNHGVFGRNSQRDDVGVDQKLNLLGSMKSEAELRQHQEQYSNYGSASSQGFYQRPSELPVQGQSLDYGAVSMAMDRSRPMKMEASTSNLIRQSSSPAGLFSGINSEGYSASSSIGKFGAGGEVSFSRVNRFGDHMNLSSRLPPSSSGKMSPIAEMEKKNTARNALEGGEFGEGPNSSYITGFPVGSSWDDSVSLSDNFTGRDEDEKGFFGLGTSEAEDEKGRLQVPGLLAHHLSLPKNSSEIEKLLQLQDSVPCKIRAKRGCATHPRSIAERVRRTKISERIRRLQDLVPNMDKQTNTADMLELAVEYIKDLQEQVKNLSDSHAKCTCANKHEL